MDKVKEIFNELFPGGKTNDWIAFKCAIQELDKHRVCNKCFKDGNCAIQEALRLNSNIVGFISFDEFGCTQWKEIAGFKEREE